MLLKQTNGIAYYQFPNLAAFSGVWHGVFTRHNGFSDRPYRSLNVSLGVGDDREDVLKNRQLVLSCSPGETLIFANQQHGANVLTLTSKAAEGIDPSGFRVSKGDALITDIRGKSLVIKVADCQPVLLIDPERHVIANIHSGWRGSLQNIIGRTVKVMKERFGCLPARIQAGIGPSLGPCCGEFTNYKSEIPEAFWKYRSGERHFDFWSMSRDQLENAGIPKGQVHIDGRCTRCHTEQFFSYRAEGVTGRFASVVTLI
jgi:YfiH family protein